MHDKLLPKGMCSGSHGLFKYWEITVQLLTRLQLCRAVPLQRPSLLSVWRLAQKMD